LPVKFIFDDPKLQGWMLLHQTYDSISKCEDKKLAAEGITAQQHAILMAIHLSDKAPSLTQVADWVDRHVNSITLIVDRMTKAGLVKRVRNSQDRRSYDLVMSKKGEKALQAGVMAGYSLIQELLSGFSDKELQRLSDILEKVRAKTIEQYYEKKTVTEVKVPDNSDVLQTTPERSTPKKSPGRKKKNVLSVAGQ
jgi:DNA-binding MarR family transcriptional regulator